MSKDAKENGDFGNAAENFAENLFTNRKVRQKLTKFSGNLDFLQNLKKYGLGEGYSFSGRIRGNDSRTAQATHDLHLWRMPL
jgi:hypothetical protein